MCVVFSPLMLSVRTGRSPKPADADSLRLTLDFFDMHRLCFTRSRQSGVDLYASLQPLSSIQYVQFLVQPAQTVGLTVVCLLAMQLLGAA